MGHMEYSCGLFFYIKFKLMKQIRTTRIAKLLILIIGCVLSTLAKADHFAGGDITYTCLGNNQYEITLVIYRDCSPGTLALWGVQDVKVKDLDNNTIATLSLPRINIDTLDMGNSSMCSDSFTCIESHTFKSTTTLANNTNGYDLTFYDSYRNNGITNISNSGITFFGFTTNVPPPPLCNNSAKFVDGFPEVLCVNNYHCLDLSATDADGDDLEYRLVESDHSNYISPFSASNVMNGNPNLTIDVNSGIACVTPTQTGQFIITVEVDEIRNGTIIGTVRKDLQFFVVTCLPNPEACFTVNPFPASCHDLTIDVTCTINESLLSWAIEELDAGNNPTGYKHSELLNGSNYGTINISQSAGNSNYSIEPGKCYSITVTAFKLCNGVWVSDQTTKIVCIKPLVPSFAGPDQTICLGECVNIGIDPCVDVSGPCSYASLSTIWYNIVPGFNGVGFVQNVCPLETTSFYVEYTDADGCTTGDWVTVFVEEPLPALVCEDVDICVGEIYGYYPEIPISGNHYDLDFHIDFGNGNVFDYPAQSYKSAPTTIYNTPGTYIMHVEVSNSCGTVFCDKTINVHDEEFCCKPDVSCFSIPDTICYGDSLWTDMSSCYYPGPVWHQWTVAELNGAWENREVKATIPNFGIPQNTNLSESWHGFAIGKTYAVSFDVCVDCNGTTVCNTIYKFVYVEDCCDKTACFEIPEEICPDDPLVIDFTCDRLSNVTSYRVNIHEGQTNVWWQDYPGELVNTDISGAISFQSGNSYNISVDFRYDCFENGMWVSKVKTVYRTVTIEDVGINTHSLDVSCGTLINLNSYLGDCYGGEWVNVSTGLPIFGYLVLANGNESYVYRSRNSEGGCCIVEVNISCTEPAPPPETTGNQSDNRDFLGILDRFDVYPNPSKGVFTIAPIAEVEFSREARYDYQVTDVNGKIITSGENFDSQTPFDINLSDFPVGIYILKVESDDFKKNYKLIKME